MQEDPDKPQYGVNEFLKDTGRDLANEGLAYLKWAGWGAAIGSVTGAGAGLYLFGTEGLAFLALGGLVVGAVAAFLLRFFLSAGPLD